MKELFGQIILVLIFMNIAYSCTFDEKVLLHDEQLEVVFNVDVSDVVVKSEWTDADNDGTGANCPDPNNFKDEISRNLYTAEYDIKLASSVQNGGAIKTFSNIPLSVIRKNGKEYVSTGLITLRIPTSGNHTLMRFLIRNSSGAIVYSSVGPDSFYATHVNRTTPFELVFTNASSGLSNSLKTEVEVDVLCAVNKLP